jgi:hypothetical protein
MADFITVTRADTGLCEVVNLDAVETVEKVPAVVLDPIPLEAVAGPTPRVTAAQVESAILTFISGRPPIAVSESLEELAALPRNATDLKATTELGDARRKKLGEVAQKRLADFHERKTRQLEATHAAAKAEEDRATAAKEAQERSHAARLEAQKATDAEALRVAHLTPEQVRLEQVERDKKAHEEHMAAMETQHQADLATLNATTPAAHPAGHPMQSGPG